jgi:hypothetical protein
MKSAVARAAADSDIQDNMRTVLEELREAGDRIQGKRDHSTRNTMLLVSGIAIGILMNPVTGPSTRRWIKEKVLGPTDDFTYGGDSSSSWSSSESTPSSGTPSDSTAGTTSGTTAA